MENLPTGSTEVARTGGCNLSYGPYGSVTGRKRSTKLQPIARYDPIQLDDIWHCKSLYERGQELFTLTGSTHSAAVFQLNRGFLAFAEDIGRHNAFDKAIGQVLRSHRIGDAYLTIVSSRLSFEMVQKAGRLGVQIFLGLSAPTSKAVQLAEDLNITLIGFLRDTSLTIYTHPGRIITNMSLQKNG
jgi:FdhD protein